jgi:hypothetical protein
MFCTISLTLFSPRATGNIPRFPNSTQGRKETEHLHYYFVEVPSYELNLAKSTHNTLCRKVAILHPVAKRTWGNNSMMRPAISSWRLHLHELLYVRNYEIFRNHSTKVPHLHEL